MDTESDTEFDRTVGGNPPSKFEARANPERFAAQHHHERETMTPSQQLKKLASKAYSNHQGALRRQKHRLQEDLNRLQQDLNTNSSGEEAALKQQRLQQRLQQVQLVLDRSNKIEFINTVINTVQYITYNNQVHQLSSDDILEQAIRVAKDIMNNVTVKTANGKKRKQNPPPTPTPSAGYFGTQRAATPGPAPLRPGGFFSPPPAPPPQAAATTTTPTLAAATTRAAPTSTATDLFSVAESNPSGPEASLLQYITTSGGGRELTLQLLSGAVLMNGYANAGNVRVCDALMQQLTSVSDSAGTCSRCSRLCFNYFAD